MGHLDIGGVQVAYRSSGSGPVLLAPECNFRWTTEFETLMAAEFTLIVATPRDFGASTRTHGPYDPGGWAADLLAVTRHLGHERFLVFGYSFTGALGPWLALRLRETAAVTAVASGGFPLLGDYGVTADDVDSQMASLADMPQEWARWEQHFDPRAGAAFYRDLAALPPDALVDRRPCPLYSFWGADDQDAVGMVMPSDRLAEGLTRRGVPNRQYPGLDHEGLNADLSAAWPETAAWLHEQASR